MTSRLRPYLTYIVLIAIGALISVGGLTWAHYNDRVNRVTPAVTRCAALRVYDMPDYCFYLK